MKRFPKLPPNLRIVVRHFHPNNSIPSQRYYYDHRTNDVVVSDYLTTARIVDRDTGDTLFTASAVCGINDQPSRKRGYQIAVGRVISKYWRSVGAESDDYRITE